MRSSESLRILHVSEVHWGGVVSLLQHFVREQSDAGHEVHVLAHRAMHDLAGTANVHPWSLDRAAPSSLLPAMRELRTCVRALEPDVVHLHSFVAGAVGRLPLHVSGTGTAAVVYQPHAWSDQLSARPGFGFLVRTLERSSGGRTDLLVTNGPDELTRAEDLGVRVPGSPIGVAVDLTRFRPPTPAERAEARARLCLDRDQRVALVLARLSRQKGQDLLVPEWRRHRPDRTMLALVGPGEPSTLADLAGDQWGGSVAWFGEHPDVLPWLWAADVLVLCSRYEGLPIVVAEAMATGLPVVTTAVDGVTGILVGGGLPAAGAVVPLGDMRGLVTEVERRLEDPDLHACEAAAGVARARELFAPAVVADRLVDAYRRAIDHRQGIGHRRVVRRKVVAG